MTNAELEAEALKRATKGLPPRQPTGDLRNIKRIYEFIKRYDKAVKDILEEEHD